MKQTEEVGFFVQFLGSEISWNMDTISILEERLTDLFQLFVAHRQLFHFLYLFHSFDAQKM